MARAAAEKREQESTAGPVVEVNAKTAMALNTLKVDITKILLDEIKGLSKPWAKMDEREQERIIHQCGDLAGNLVHNATTIIGTKGFPYYEIAVGKVAVDKGIEFKGTLPFDPKAIGEICARRNQSWMLIARDERQFLGGKPPTPDNVGSLAMPKGKEKEAPTSGPGSPSDENAMEQLGRGKPGSGKVAKVRLHHGVPVEGEPSNEQQMPEGEGETQDEQHDPVTGELANDDRGPGKPN